MNAAANQYGQLQQINNEQKATQLGFITSLAGAGAEVATMCWIARELFGSWNAYETRIIRKYLSGKLRIGPWYWRNSVFLYIRYGRQWAKHIKTHSIARAVTRSIFEWLFVKAQMEIPERARRVVFDSYWDTSRRERAGARRNP